MGIGTVLNGSWDDVLNTSLRQWLGINSRVLLLVFLPGLIYKDAFGQVRGSVWKHNSTNKHGLIY